MFQNFNNFAFARSMHTEPLTVSYANTGTKNRNDLGQPDGPTTITKQVNETLVNNTNPNFNLSSTDGGQYDVGTLYWVSALNDVPEHATVTRANSDKFEVTGIANDYFGGLTCYTVKRIGVKHR